MVLVCWKIAWRFGREAFDSVEPLHGCNYCRETQRPKCSREVVVFRLTQLGNRSRLLSHPCRVLCTSFVSLIKMRCVSYILFLGLLSMCCMGVAMLCVGEMFYGDDVSTYLKVGGISVFILYLLPLLLVKAYIKETRNGKKLMWTSGVGAVGPFYALLLFPLSLVCLPILIWGTIMVISASGNIIIQKVWLG